MLPSGSRNAAKWQTPESQVSAMNSTPFASSSARAVATSATRSANPASFATKGSFSRSGSQKLSVTFGVSTSPFVASPSGSPKTSRYPGDRSRGVARRDRDEVDEFDLHRYVLTLPPCLIERGLSGRLRGRRQAS